MTHIWSPPSVCSLLLCERDEQTVSLLRSWAVKHGDIEIEIAAGDWRTRFDRALPKQEGLVFISFDPYMFNRHRRKENPGNMYPADLDRLVDATGSFPENILIQLSTYDTNDDNGQNAVAECIRSGLESGGFEEVAIVKPSAKMMSLLYQRRVDFSAELTSLPRSPVRGDFPIRPCRLFVEYVPKPVAPTDSPLARQSWIVSNSALTASFTCALHGDTRLAT